MNERFVFDDIEVRKTGRKAIRKTQRNRTHILLEITAVNLEMGSWTRWVKEDELYKICSGDIK